MHAGRDYLPLDVYREFAGLMISTPFTDTCVEIWRRGPNGWILQSSFSFTDTYQTAQVVVANGTWTSGLLVNSSRPISVLSGVSCGEVPGDTQYCDHMAEQIPPTSELGTKFVVPPIYGRSYQAGQKSFSIVL